MPPTKRVRRSKLEEAPEVQLDSGDESEDEWAQDRAKAGGSGSAQREDEDEDESESDGEGDYAQFEDDEGEMDLDEDDGDEEVRLSRGPCPQWRSLTTSPTPADQTRQT